MVILLLSSFAVLVLLAWRFPDYRAAIGAVLAAILVGTWAWLEFRAPPDEPPEAAVPVDVLEVEDTQLSPWHGEHRLRGTAHNRSDWFIVTGFDVQLHVRDCIDGECTSLGVHRQRVNLRIAPSSTETFERRIRLFPGTAFDVRGELEADIVIDEVHGRGDIRRERAPARRGS